MGRDLQFAGEDGRRLEFPPVIAQPDLGSALKAATAVKVPTTSG